MLTATTDPSELEAMQQVAADILTLHRGQLCELTIRVVEGGIVIRGRAVSYYGKQIAFHEVTRLCEQPVVANEIEVLPRSVAGVNSDRSSPEGSASRN